VRVFLILLGLLLILGGGAVAGAQYAPPNLLAMLDSAPQARDFLLTQTALFVGAGVAGFGLLLLIIGAVAGGKKKDKEAAQPKASAKPKEAPRSKEAAPTKPAEAVKPAPAPAPAPVQAAPAAAKAPEPRPAPPVVPVAPATIPKPATAPVSAPSPAPQAAAAVAEAPKPKPQASAQPPASAQEAAPAPAGPSEATRTDPRLVNRKRVQDLVTINDALKAYHKAQGAYPVASGLGGILDRGANWIPGLTDILPELPRDPAMSMDRSGPQYVYASDGKDYKLIALNVSLVGSTNPAVLGIRIDTTRNPTQENAAFGFWTEGFASA